MIVYGPVPSRRLGQSIGINNIPAKICSYSCTYCQLGRTNKMQVARREFYKADDIFREAETKIKKLNFENKYADFISFVPDGEPTLDKNLGLEINLLKQFKIKIAVITNASLIWMDDVKEDLMNADWVSVKIDAVDEHVWHKIDRPHGLLEIQKIIEGIIDFSKEFKGTIVTETMLVDGVNDNKKCLEDIAKNLGIIKPSKAYLLVPTRPPAEDNVKRASSKSVINAAKLIKNLSGVEVECITGDEKEDGFFFTQDIIDDVLSITAVHPVREDIINDLLKKRNLNCSIINELVKNNKIIEFWYEGKKFYRKNLLNL